MVSPGVGASWARSSGSSLSLVKRESPGSPVAPVPPEVKKLLMWWGLNRDSVCSKEKIIDFSSMSLQDRGQKESRVSAEYVWRTHEQRFEIWPVFTQTSVLTWGRSWCTRCTAAESCGCYKSQFPGFLPRRSLRSWPACGTDCSLPDPWYTLQRRTRGRQIYVMSCCIRGHVSVVGTKVHSSFWTLNLSHSHTILFLENWN